MKFLSDILAKAGLTVDGVVTLNNTATGQTPATNDNSTKLATTEFIKNQSYLSANQTITVSGDATGSGTTSIILTLANSGVTAGVYGNASNIPTITVDAKGRITSISTNAVSIITTLAGLSDVTLTSPSANQVLQYNGTQWVNGAAPVTYTLPIATSSILGGIKVGSGLSIDAATGILTVSGGSGGSFNFRTIQEFTSTAGQTTYTISGGYNVGYVEVLINGVYISENQYTATNGTTIVLNDASTAGDIVTVFLYSLYNLGTSVYARNVDTLTATAGQTSFTTSYIPGQIDVYYNGSKLTAAEYTATTGSSIVLAQAAVSGDIVEVVTYLAGAGINASRTLTINGTTYDLTANRTWTLTTANISEVTNLYYTDARVATYLTTNSYATQSYVGTQLANLVASAPSTLDTLNELASALGNDPSFATTIATSIGTKVPQTRTITINGTAYDLSADRSWTIASGVTSFNTRTGAITAASGDYTTAQVTESGNLYYTDTRARLAISLTTTGTSGAATYDSATGIFNIPQYQGGVTSFNTRTGAITLSSSDVNTALTYTPVTNARTISINGTSYDLTADRSWTIAPDVSVRNTYAFTATAAQTTFTVSGGYTVGLVDVFINGVKLAAADFTATNGTTVVLGTGTGVGNIVEIVKYVSAFTTAVETTRTLTINGTTYDLSANRTWSIDNASLGAQAQLNGTGLVRMSGTTVSYDNATYATQSYVTTAVANLVNSAPSTLDTLNELATALGNDANFATTITTSIGTKQAQLNGTGFVKISGTTISYDNSTYLTTASASSTYLPLAGGTLSGTLNFAQPVGVGFANGQYIKDNGLGGLVIYSGAAVNITATSLIVSGAVTFSSTLSTTGNITSYSDIIANGGSSTAVYVYNSSSIRAKLSMTGNEGDLTLYSSSGVAKIYLSAYYNSYFNAGNVIIGGTADFNRGAKLQITQNSSNTNAIDFKNTDATYSHIGTFANNMYLTQNYYYAGGQNADNTSYGQAAITMGVGTTTGSSYIDFAMSDPGASSPSGKVRIAGNGHFMVGTTTDYNFWPSWDGSVIRIGQGGAIWHYRDSMLDFMISSNYYISSSGAQETRMAAGGSANIYMNNGNILFRTSAVGTAGSSISWINALNLTNAGNATFSRNIALNGVTPRNYFYSGVNNAGVNLGGYTDIFALSNQSLYIGTNMYYDNGWFRPNTGYAAMIELVGSSGGINFYNQTTGTGGLTITPNPTMVLSGVGNLGVGTISPSGRLGVQTTGADGLVMEPDLGSVNNSGRLFFKSSVQTYGLFNNSADLRLTYDAVPGNTSGTSLARFANTGKYFRMEAGTGGIQFGGDTAATSALNDYEEGTWTPVIGASSGAATYTTQLGWYTKVGRLVTITWFVSFLKNSLSGGTLRLTNFPFVLLSGGAFYPQGTVLLDSLSTTTNNITLQGANNSNSGDFIGGNGTTATHTGLPLAVLGAASMECRGTLTYFSA